MAARQFFMASAMLLSGLAAAAETSATEQTPRSTCYLFSYFMGNGEDGLYLAHSQDGLRWKPLGGGKPFVAPAVGGKLMRDPFICLGPDGVFRMVWTCGGSEKGIGIAHSKDLLNWSEQKWLPLMEDEPDALNCWAPEIFYDAQQKQYLIHWSTTIEGRFPETAQSGDQANRGLYNHRIY